MASTRRLLTAALLAAAFLAAAAGVLAAVGAPLAPPAAAETRDIGGPFALTTQHGTPFTDADLAGTPVALFFGFTHCPDICPTTLWEMSEALGALGPDGDRVKIVFVTIDPARDTAPVLADYLAVFDPRIVGLTGSEDAVAGMARLYRAFWQKVPTEDGDYTMNHTAFVLLIDRAGRFAGTIGYSEAAAPRLAKLRGLIDG